MTDSISGDSVSLQRRGERTRIATDNRVIDGIDRGGDGVVITRDHRIEQARLLDEMRDARKQRAVLFAAIGASRAAGADAGSHLPLNHAQGNSISHGGPFKGHHSPFIVMMQGNHAIFLGKDVVYSPFFAHAAAG
jgi:hypothetical protein